MKALHSPIKIAGFSTGLVQSREEFLLPQDAFITLENAFVWRERVKRKQGTVLLGRLSRVLTSQVLGTTDVSGNFTGNIRTILSLESTANIEISSITIVVGGTTFTDYSDSNGTLIASGGGGSGSINYTTLNLSLSTVPAIASTNVVITFTYYPSLPVMGLRQRELVDTSFQQTIAFDMKYAYVYGTSWTEWIPGTTWTGSNSQFFWTTNYWVSSSNVRLFWVTNFKDPIRYTDGITWTDFTPQIDSVGTLLNKTLLMTPFRGRMVVLNTVEGTTNFYQRIRWSAIGNPFTTNAWRDDIIGQGGFLDIPKSESITSIGFVRDYLVISCENSTWNLRYTGLAISPFQVEKTNSELGIRSTFSNIQFDTSLIGVGSKGIAVCDSYKTSLINIKLPDITFDFVNTDNGPIRVQGVRDFVQRLAYWIYPDPSPSYVPVVFPNRRLVYNYENDSWSIFTDSFTALGTFQVPLKRTWAQSHFTWASQHIQWLAQQSLTPDIIGGNQQGFVSKLDMQTENDSSLSISNIVGNGSTATVITSINHNLPIDQIISIKGIAENTGYEELNGGIFRVVVEDANTFTLYKYSFYSEQFSAPQVNAPANYVGGGLISLRDNFRIVSKKFSFIDEGQNIEMSNCDFLVENTDEGAFTMNVYQDYNNEFPTNQEPENHNSATNKPDPFFNTIVPTSQSDGLTSQKSIYRAYCPTFANFLTIELTLSNAQMNGVEYSSFFQLDMMTLWVRRAGKSINFGG